MLPVLAVLAAALLFGTTGTAQALGPEHTTPLSVGAARLVIGGTGLAIIALIAGWRRRRQVDAAATATAAAAAAATVAAAARPSRRIRPRDAALVAVTALCLVLYQPLFFLGTARNGVAVGTVVALGSAPVIAGVLEWIVRRTVPRTTWLTATGLATVGVALLGFGGQASSGAAASSAAGTDLAGILGSIGAGASFAVLAVAQRRLLDGGWAAMSAVGAMGGIAAIASLPLLLLTDTAWLRSGEGITMALWLGLVTTTTAYALFTWGLAGLTAATAATLTLGEPLTASILGIVVLGERLAPLALVGLAVLAAGLVLLAWGSRSAKSRPFAVEG